MKSSKRFYYPQSRRLKPRELIRVYRTLRGAFGHQHWWPGQTPFEVMIGAILTQNTAWTHVEKAIGNLKRAGKLNWRALDRISPTRLAQLIRPAGYFNIKADRLKHFIHFLKHEYGGKISKMKTENGARLREKLLAVKGIGEETADSILLYALEKPFFVIDAYTKRVFARHRFHDLEASYQEWQRKFEEKLPPRVDLYNDFHAQIVHVGKNFCRTRPACELCPLQKYL